MGSLVPPRGCGRQDETSCCAKRSDGTLVLSPFLLLTNLRAAGASIEGSLPGVAYPAVYRSSDGSPWHCLNQLSWARPLPIAADPGKPGATPPDWTVRRAYCRLHRADIAGAGDRHPPPGRAAAATGEDRRRLPGRFRTGAGAAVRPTHLRRPPGSTGASAGMMPCCEQGWGCSRPSRACSDCGPWCSQRASTPTSRWSTSHHRSASTCPGHPDRGR